MSQMSLCLLLSIVSSLSQAGELMDSGPMLQSTDPARSASLIATPTTASVPKVVYGTDDRVDVYEESDTQRAQWAKSVCGIVFSSDLIPNDDGGYTLQTYPYTYFSYPLCEGQQFADQPTAPYCTAFLVTPDVVATTSHCFLDLDLVDSRFVFGFTMTDAETPVTDFAADQVYQGVEIIERGETGEDGSGPDYVLVRLDRPVGLPYALPLPLRREGTPGEDTPIGVIGHPAGLPVKISFGPDTRVIDDNPAYYFLANLDTFGGSSGSPVINPQTGLVEGLLVFGESDYVFDDNCVFVATLEDGDGGEGVLRSLAFADAVPERSDAGFLRLSSNRLACEAELSISLLDANLPSDAVPTVNIVSSNGDSETLQLTRQGQLFTGSITCTAGDANLNDNLLNVAHGVTISVQYLDADAGDGPATIEETATVDCIAPELASLEITNITGSSIEFSVTADEPALLTAEVLDESCATQVDLSSTNGFALESSLTVGGLEQESDFTYSIALTDEAGNSTRPESGQCVPFSTLQLNDTCDSALPIALDEVVSGDNTAADTDTSTTCASGDYGDVWYSFSAPEAGGYRIETCGSLVDTTLAIFKGDCDTLLEIACEDDTCGFQESACVALVQDEQVYIRVATYSFLDAGEFFLSVSMDSSCTSGLPVTAAFTLEPESGIAPLRVTATNSSSNADVYIWDFGDGHTGTSPSPVHVFQQPGEYQVCLTAFGINDATWSTDTVCQTVLVAPGAPDNDSCARAWPLTTGRTVYATNVGAQTDYEPAQQPPKDGADIWFSYDIPESGVYRITTVDSTIETTIGAFSGNCSDGDMAAFLEGQELWMTLFRGRRLLLRIAGVNGAVGDLHIRIERAIDATGPAGKPMGQGFSCGSGPASPSGHVTDGILIILTGLMLTLYHKRNRTGTNRN